MTAKMLTPKEVAQKFATDPKTLRKFLRKDAKDNGVEAPGKGSRWTIPAMTLKSLQKRFDAWNATKPATTPDSGDATEIAEDDAITEEVLDEG